MKNKFGSFKRLWMVLSFVVAFSALNIPAFAYDEVREEFDGEIIDILSDNGIRYRIKTIGEDSADLIYIGAEDYTTLSENIVLPYIVSDNSTGKVYKINSIGDGTCSVCGDVKDATLTIENGIKGINNGAFADCTGFKGDLIIPESIEYLGTYSDNNFSLIDGCFSKCEGFSGNLSIPSSVKTIGVYAFEGCKGFSSLSMNRGLEVISPGAFIDCEGLKGHIDIPHGVKKMAAPPTHGMEGKDYWTIYGPDVFSQCTGIESVSIPNTVEVINPDEFTDCSNLKMIINRSGCKVNAPLERQRHEWKNAKTGAKTELTDSGTYIVHPIGANCVMLRDDFKGRIGVDLNDPDFKGSDYFDIKLDDDYYVVRWNTDITYDGRKHCAVGMRADGTADVKGKNTSKKVYDIFVTITKNGEVIDPSEYTIKLKHDTRNAYFSVDDVTDEGVMTMKPFSYKNYDIEMKIKLKGINGNIQDSNNINRWLYTERYLVLYVAPALLTESNLQVADPVSKGGTLKYKKAVFTSSGDDPQTVKLKCKKSEKKTDYTVSVSSNGDLLFTGKNNFCGTVVIKQ